MARFDMSGSAADRADVLACLEAIEEGALKGAAAKAERERGAD